MIIAPHFTRSEKDAGYVAYWNTTYWFMPVEGGIQFVCAKKLLNTEFDAEGAPSDPPDYVMKMLNAARWLNSVPPLSRC